MTNIEFEYFIGDIVKVKDTDIKGRIISVYISEVGIQYQITYIWDGDGKRCYFFGFELELVNESKLKSFGIIK